MSAPKTLALRDMSLVDVETDRKLGSTASSMTGDVTGPLDTFTFKKTRPTRAPAADAAVSSRRVKFLRLKNTARTLSSAAEPWRSVVGADSRAERGMLRDRSLWLEFSLRQGS